MANIVDEETDARFWATGYRPGHKLDPSDPADAAMIPVWNDIHAKVQREHDTGKLVTTFDKPAVAHKIAEAHAANQAAVAHLDAAKKSSDATAAQHHLGAAHAALEIGTAKMNEVAAVQPKTVSPQLAREASQHAVERVPSPEAPAAAHVANVQAQAAYKPMPKSIIDRETDARFYAQSGYKPGQKLDPKNPADAKMIPVWLDIYKKVKAEDRAGRLVLTYNNPAVAQRISDAHVADQVAAAHRDAAAAHPEAAHENMASAAVAEQISRHRTREAATAQPPSISPDLAHRAARRADEEAVRETYERFWMMTRFRPGHRLDPRDPLDARMIPTWESLYQRTMHDRHAREGRPFTGREQVAHDQARRAGHYAAGAHRGHGPRRRPVQSTVPPGRVQDFREQAARLAHEAGGQFVLVVQHPDGTADHQAFGSRQELDAAYAKLSEQHDQYRYIAEFDLGANPRAPVNDSVGIPAAEHVEEPTQPAPEEGAGPAEPSPEEPKKWSTGKIAAIVGLVVVGGGGVLYAATRKKKSPRSAKVLVATPARARPTRVLVPSSAPGT